MESFKYLVAEYVENRIGPLSNTIKKLSVL